MTLKRIPHTELWKCVNCNRIVDGGGHKCGGSLGDIIRTAVGCQALCQDNREKLNRLWNDGWCDGSMDNAIGLMLDDANGGNRVRSEYAASVFVTKAIQILEPQHV